VGPPCGSGKASWRNDGGGRTGLDPSGSGIDGANGTERARFGQTRSLRVGVRFIVKAVGRGDLEHAAGVSLSPASY
jgi:hypothetical protein